MNPESERETAQRAAVVVLGENLKFGWDAQRIEDNPQHMSISSKMNALAGAQTSESLLRAGYDVAEIISSGFTTKYSEAEWMKKWTVKPGRYPNLNQRIILEEISRETPGNAEEATKILDKYNFSKKVLVVPKDHMKRTVKLFKAYGTDFDEIVIAEDVYVNDPNITESTRQRREELVRNYRNSVWGRMERVKEGILAFELNFDPKGKLVKFITGGFRGRRKKDSSAPAHA